MRVAILSSVHDALDNRVFYREALSLKQAGFDVHLIACHPRDYRKMGVTIHGLPVVPRWLRPLLWIKLVKQAISINPDVFHFHDPELLLIVPILKLLSGKPTIYDVHEVYPDFIMVKDYLPRIARELLSRLMVWIEPLLARLNDGLIFADREIAKQFNHIDLPMATVFNFPSIEFLEQVPNESEISRSTVPKILYLGGLERNRGSSLMVDSLSRIREEVPNARLVIVGHFMPPDLKDEFIDHCKEKGVDSSVEISGRIPFDAIGSHLESAWIGWIPWQSFPKNEKNIPTKLFEYMAYYLPIVSSDLQSTRQFISNGDNGFLVEPDNPTGHAEAILSLINDRDLRNHIGRRNRDLVVNTYNWEMMHIELINLYKDVLGTDQLSGEFTT